MSCSLDVVLVSIRKKYSVSQVEIQSLMFAKIQSKMF